MGISFLFPGRQHYVHPQQFSRIHGDDGSNCLSPGPVVVHIEALVGSLCPFAVSSIMNERFEARRQANNTGGLRPKTYHFLIRGDPIMMSLCIAQCVEIGRTGNCQNVCACVEPVDPRVSSTRLPKFACVVTFHMPLLRGYACFLLLCQGGRNTKLELGCTLEKPAPHCL